MENRMFNRKLVTRLHAETCVLKLHSASYAAFCRKNGNHQVSNQKPRCWNNELMEQARPTLDPRWEALRDWLIFRMDTLHSDISTSFRIISDTLQGMSLPHQAPYDSQLSLVCGLFSNLQYSPGYLSVAPQAIENLFSLLSHRKGYIIHIFKNTLAQLIHETEYAQYKISTCEIN